MTVTIRIALLLYPGLGLALSVQTVAELEDKKSRSDPWRASAVPKGALPERWSTTEKARLHCILWMTLNQCHAMLCLARHLFNKAPLEFRTDDEHVATELTCTRILQDTA